MRLPSNWAKAHSRQRDLSWPAEDPRGVGQCPIEQLIDEVRLRAPQAGRVKIEDFGYASFMLASDGNGSTSGDIAYVNGGCNTGHGRGYPAMTLSYIDCRTCGEIAFGNSVSLIRELNPQNIGQDAMMSADVNLARIDTDYAMTNRFRGVMAHGMLGGALDAARKGMIQPILVDPRT